MAKIIFNIIHNCTVSKYFQIFIMLNMVAPVRQLYRLKLYGSEAGGGGLTKLYTPI